MRPKLASSTTRHSALHCRPLSSTDNKVAGRASAPSPARLTSFPSWAGSHSRSPWRQGGHNRAPPPAPFGPPHKGPSRAVRSGGLPGCPGPAVGRPYVPCMAISCHGASPAIDLDHVSSAAHPFTPHSWRAPRWVVRPGPAAKPLQVSGGKIAAQCTSPQVAGACPSVHGGRPGNEPRCSRPPALELAVAGPGPHGLAHRAVSRIGAFPGWPAFQAQPGSRAAPTGARPEAGGYPIEAFLLQQFQGRQAARSGQGPCEADKAPEGLQPNPTGDTDRTIACHGSERMPTGARLTRDRRGRNDQG